MLPALGLAAAVLAGVVALELTSGAPSRVAAGRVAAVSPEVAAAPGVDPAPQQVAMLLNRPPFSPTRRPDAVQGADDPRLPHLTGILVTSQERKAIFAGRDGGRGAVVGQGDQVGAYRVQDISAADVTLAGADGPHVVRPTYSMTPAPVPAMAPLAALTLPQLQPPAIAAPGGPPPLNAPVATGAGSPR